MKCKCEVFSPAFQNSKQIGQMQGFLVKEQRQNQQYTITNFKYANHEFIMNAHTFDATNTEAPPRIPIVIGIVGHRDIRKEDRQVLRTALNRIYEEFDRAYPYSPKVLLSPLAPGADQLAADAALYLDKDKKQPRVNWSVRAPLPFSPNDLRKSTSFTFKHLIDLENNPAGTDYDALSQFDAFLANPRVEWFVVPLPDTMVIEGQYTVFRDSAWHRASANDASSSEPLDWSAILTSGKNENQFCAAFRRACYANPGGYIVRNCDTLIALWDGKDVEKPSGTAEIVRFQLGGKAPEHYPWTPNVPIGFDGDRGPVIWLRTCRVNSHDSDVTGQHVILVPSPEDKMYFGEQVNISVVARRLTNGERFWRRCSQAFFGRQASSSRLEPIGSYPGPCQSNPMRTQCPEYDQFLSICQMLEDFNFDASKLYTRKSGSKEYCKRLEKAEGETEAIFQQTEKMNANLHSVPARELNLRILRVRETAAYLAKRLKPLHNGISLSLLFLLFIALLAFHIYAHPFWEDDHAVPKKHPQGLIAAFGVLWLTLFGLVAVAWWLRLDERRHDYRSLAEALRVRQIYAAAGSSRSVANTYLAQLRTELAWIRRALQHLCPPSEFWLHQFQLLTDERKKQRLEWVHSNWIKGQENQHKESRDELHHSAGWYRRWGYCSVFFGLVLLAVIPWVGPISSLFQEQQQHTLYPLAKPEQDNVNANGKQIGNKTAESAHEKKNNLTDWLHPERPLNILLLFGTMTIIFGGTLITLNERRCCESLAKQYDRIYVVFRGGNREMKNILARHPFDYTRAQRVIEELGREALQENVEWLLLFRSKPLELPIGA